MAQEVGQELDRSEVLQRSMSREQMKRIIYIPFDHLHRKFGALKDADPKNDVIAFVESARMTTGRNWHKERLFFLISSARHFAATLEEEGFTVKA
jgi:deoxyribodipyrimidine photolyase-related protein